MELIKTKRTDKRLLKRMSIHYSQPKGFVGRNICYAVCIGDDYYGHIIGGSATKHLQGRHLFLGTSDKNLNNVVNNIFFNVCPINEKYPCRNFTTKVIKLFMSQIRLDWEEKYGDRVVGFETLVEKPRIGTCYLRSGWSKVGETIGYTCKRVAGKGTDSWTGKRVWDTKNLRPKNILCYKV